ncbi:MAG TPA: methyltransferase domain-containing protein, partial [Bryobacteraceae bacterium]|nr:methyltransferase domain-containing protein [Bryobacteraceae bacterium]
MPQWDADIYLRFANERTQPVRDLIHRIQLENPRRIVDLGCGPGNSTAELRERWPSSTIVGLDSSREMIDKARAAYPDGAWEVGDAA